MKTAIQNIGKREDQIKKRVSDLEDRNMETIQLEVEREIKNFR